MRISKIFLGRVGGKAVSLNTCTERGLLEVGKSFKREVSDLAVLTHTLAGFRNHL